MNKNSQAHKWFTLPNFFSYFRIAAAPALVILALAGERMAVFVLFAISLSTDAIDGWLARKMGQTSDWGAQLDGWGDLFNWTAMFICFFILWPEIARREAPFAIFGFTSFILPVIIGFIKYGEFPSYHCWSAKVQTIFMGIAVFLLLIKGIAWPFRIGAIFQGLVAAEDITITLLLTRCHCNVKSLRHGIRLAREGK